MGWLNWMDSSNSWDLMALYSAVLLFQMRKKNQAITNSYWNWVVKIAEVGQFIFLYPCTLQCAFTAPPKSSILCFYLDWSCDLLWLRKWQKSWGLASTAISWNPAITMWTDKPAGRYEATWSRYESAGVIQTSQLPSNHQLMEDTCMNPRKNRTAQLSPAQTVIPQYCRQINNLFLAAKLWNGLLHSKGQRTHNSSFLSW